MGEKNGKGKKKMGRKTSPPGGRKSHGGDSSKKPHRLENWGKQGERGSLSKMQGFAGPATVS